MILNQNTKIKRKRNSISFNLMKVIESKYTKIPNIIGEKSKIVEIGDIIKISYLIAEGEKDRIQNYEGVVIAKNNRGLGQSFTIRRTVQGIGIEQIFLLNSPKIVSIIKKQASKVRRAKLYYLRELNGKSTRLKVKL
jgi:large subunit ribosomal protein L19